MNNFDRLFFGALLVVALVFAFLFGMGTKGIEVLNQIDNTGIEFCESYDLEFVESEFQDATDSYKFICTNNTESKVDGIGILKRSG